MTSVYCGNNIKKTSIMILIFCLQTGKFIIPLFKLLWQKINRYIWLYWIAHMFNNSYLNISSEKNPPLQFSVNYFISKSEWKFYRNRGPFWIKCQHCPSELKIIKKERKHNGVTQNPKSKGPMIRWQFLKTLKGKQ